MKRTVFIVDDHPMMRRGYASLIGDEPDLAVCGEASSATEALAALERAVLDLVVSDVSVEGTNGIELMKQLGSLYPELPVLFISMHDEALYAERALRAGARGYLMKMEEDETVLRAMRRVLDGHIALSDTMQNRLLCRHIGQHICLAEQDDTPALHSLSDRELEVLELIGRGFSTRDVAERLSISPKTVESHRALIKRKLAVPTAAQLLRCAMRWVGTIGAGAG